MTGEPFHSKYIAVVIETIISRHGRNHTDTQTQARVNIATQSSLYTSVVRFYSRVREAATQCGKALRNIEQNVLVT